MPLEKNELLDGPRPHTLERHIWYDYVSTFDTTYQQLWPTVTWDSFVEQARTLVFHAAKLYRDGYADSKEGKSEWAEDSKREEPDMDSEADTVMLYNSDPENREVEDEQLSVGEAEMSLSRSFSAYRYFWRTLLVR